ncbi:MAG: CopG family transcriptional regulator [Candidatus Dadabacteria bacterium]|nr:CopG family transcriptional regulator [Candidatus Dadabacteria bacterium]
MSKGSTRISFIAPAGKRKRLDNIAEAFGKKLSVVINEALDQYIDLHEWQLSHIRKGVKAAHRGDFATEAQVKAFFDKYGQAS